MSKRNNKQLFRDIRTLVFGSSSAKLIGLISIPIITRVYGPQELGELSIFLAIVSLLIPLFTLRYNIAIPLPEKEEESYSLLKLCFVSCCIWFILTMILASISFFKFEYSEIFGVNKYYILLMPSVAFLVGIYETIESYLVRNRNFKVISKSKISQSLLGNLTKVILGVLNVGAIGLVIGHSLTLMGGLLVFVVYFKNKILKFLHYSCDMIYIARQYIEFPIYRLPSQFMLILSSKIPLLYFGYIYGTEETGQLALSFTCMAIPIALVSQNIGQVVYSEAAKQINSGLSNIYSLTKNLIKKLLIVGVFPSFILFFFSKELFIIVFGQKWELAGIYTSILSFYMLFQFISNPITSIINVVSNQKMFLLVNFLRLIMICLVFSFSYYFRSDPLSTLKNFSLIMVINYIITIAIVLRMVKDK
ncbi:MULTISPECIES: lipopolysaccharide biosynthesis protein [unclassified Vibrio]|uniref:lipopolysaccharide biosynthesis protein n=1 Tax=unclassified Vibrio TaxID=2614977 RepID=UPI0035504EAB